MNAGANAMKQTSFAVEDMTIHRLVEQETGSAPMLNFLPKLSQERLAENREWLIPAAMDPITTKAILCYQAYVVKTPHHNVLIDSCIGNHKHRPTRANWHQKDDAHFMTALAAAGLAVEDIDIVMCTHLHADHVGWNTRLENGRWVPTFPNARYLFSDKEYAYWTEQNAREEVPCVVDSVLPVVAANKVDFVKSSHQVNDHFRLVPTPGHTPDHFAVAVGRGRDAAVFTGDLIHSPLQARYTELAVSVDVDPVESGVTRRKFFEHYCDSDTLCCTAHFPSPSVGHVKRWGDGFRVQFVGT